MIGTEPGSTIFALATPAGRGAVAIIRLSGPASAQALEALCGRRVPPPRQAALRRLRDASGELVDEALVLWMPQPASFTGEDCAELHLHGGGAVVGAISDILLQAGLRLAEPGEFTRRAFENGRLDLTQAEAVADLVEAESGAQRRQALAQLGGALSRRYEVWREALLDALALLEAEIDFPDEEVPGSVGESARPVLDRIAAEMRSAAADLYGERVREGFRVAITGAPNVGKSSLLNALAGRDAAIVTEIAGTTRDVVEVPISLAGQTLILADMAGLRGTDDPIEAEGVRRARAWASAADLRVGVVDLSRPATLDALRGLVTPNDLIVFNKSDLAGAAEPAALPGIRSLRAAAGRSDVADLREALVRWCGSRSGEQDFPATTRSRHRALLLDSVTHLERARADRPLKADLAAEDVRLAARSLEQITGRSNPEAVLDRVFSSFCIGK